MFRSRTAAGRMAAVLSAVAITAAGLGGTPFAPSTAAGEPAAAAAPTLRSSALEVTVAADFPRVVSYADTATGATLGGQPDPIHTVVLNGTPHQAAATVTEVDGEARYTLTFADLPGVELDSSLAVDGRVVTFRITAVRDTEAFRVGTIDIPDHDLVSVSSGQPGATTAFTKIDPDSTRNADVIAPVTAATPVDAAPVGASYAIVNTDRLAASVETNGSYDKPAGQATRDGARFWHRARATADGARRVGVWGGQWTYRGEGSPTTSELPWAKVVVTGDANADRSVDWQDGAIAFRGISQVAAGAKQTADRVIQHIPFNFSSQATHPFLRTLDDVKRLNLATDGLGQLAVLKGYGSEGHDSAHPDYGGNYNTRAGGLKDLNTLLASGEKYGANFGVHVNATESYAEANAFNETLVNKSAPGWNWLGQSYYINQRPDLNSGNLMSRFQQLRDETHPNLQFLYIDVYYTYGWLPDEMNRRLRAQGWQVGTEWATHMERNSLWSHWAVDRNYGGATNKGINSTIIRFIRNAEKDVWNPHPILGSSTIVEAEGWTGQNDWNAMQRNIWTNQLPTKFLQHFKITDWSDHDIAFTGDVRGTDTGGRKLYVADAKVLDGNAYLLPWGKQGPLAADKLYHYDADGGTGTWTLTPRMRGVKSFTVYELTRTGRVKSGTVAASNGKVALTTKAGTPYVLYPNQAPAPVDPQYGEATPVVDPGFNAGDLGAWNPSGAVTQTVTDKGAGVVTLGPAPAAVSQKLRGLTAGKRYSASVWVEIAPGATRRTTLGVAGPGGVLGTTSVERSTMRNNVASDEKRLTSFQRVRVLFTAPGGDVTLRVAAADGAAPVRLDDVRVVESGETSPAANVLVQQDFEHNDQGWWPFVSGPAQAGGDARTHLAQKHAPYTQAGWNNKLVDDVIDGTASLKAHEEHQGLTYRTWPGTVTFQPGRRYRVEFDYENAHAGAYSWVTGTDRVVAGSVQSVELTGTTFGQQRTPGRFSQELTTGDCGDYWVGLRRLAAGGSQADLVLDNFRVTDLGAAEQPGACAKVEITGPTGGVAPGEANTFTTAFTNYESVPATAVTQRLTAPAGWTVEASSPATFATVAPGATVRTTWTVGVPADTQPGSYPLAASAGYTVAGGARTVTAESSVATIPAGMIPQARLRVHDVSSEETVGENGRAANAIDGNPSTMWHSEWYNREAPYPHHLTLDLGSAHDVDGFDYQVRNGNGQIKDYQILVSADGQTWGQPVATGSFVRTTEVQHVALPVTRGRFVKLVGLNAVNGATFGGANEINLWGKKAP